MKRYGVILGDPAWRYRNAGVNGAAAKHYRTLTLAEICALAPFGRPVRELAAKDAVLYLWATWPMLANAFQVIDAWGFTYKTGLPWVKTRRTPVRTLWDELVIRLAVATGWWLRHCTEPLLIATRGHPPVPAEDARPLGLLLDVRRKHSQKPAAQYALAERHPGPYLELFARPPHPVGWDVWGDQVAPARRHPEAA